MANRAPLKKNAKPLKQTPKPELDPVQKEFLNRLRAVDTVFSPFWAVRSAYR